MESPTYIALSRQVTIAREMEIIAHNVANANTTGFKQQRLQFNEFLTKPAQGERYSMVIDRATRRDTSQGGLMPTGNSLDVAVVGQGYFAVDTVNGPRYTRAGNFQLNEQGQIVNGGGLPVMGQGNQPITLPPETEEIRIAGDGSIYTNGSPDAPVGRLAVVRFDKEQELLEVGGGLYSTDQRPQPVTGETQVQQGVLEQSTVQPVLEMTRMIDTMRAYQQTQKMIDTEHERVRSAIGRLARQA